MFALAVSDGADWRVRLVPEVAGAGPDGSSDGGAGGAPTPSGEPVEWVGGAELVARIEAEESPRWVFAAGGTDYRAVVRAGVTVARCHDIALTERLLLARSDRHGLATGTAAVLARLRGEHGRRPMAVRPGRNHRCSTRPSGIHRVSPSTTC